MLPTKQFSKEKLMDLVLDNQIEQAKAYTKQYFFKSLAPLATMYYDYYSKSFLSFKQKGIKETILTNNIKRCDYDQRGRKMNSFSLQEWFFKEDCDFYSICCNPQKDPFYTTKEGRKYINLFTGFIHPRKPYESYSNKVKAKVEFILNHILICYCSGDKKQGGYVESWLARMVSGFKNTSILYLSGPQGAGKSCIPEFLQNQVLGSDLVYTTDSPDCLTGFNSQIRGKLLIAFEEIEKGNKVYNCINKAIKHITTCHTLELREKFKPNVQIPNLANIMMGSNDTPLKPGRRVCALDVSDSKIKDTKYFKKLYKYFKAPLVGEACYNYLRDLDDRTGAKFNDQDIPESNTQREMIVENLVGSYLFIKDEYLASDSGINLSARSLYRHYKEYSESNKIKAVTKVHFGKDMAKLGLKSIPKSITKEVNGKKIKTTQRQYIYSYDDIYKSLNKRKMIHETDEYTVPEGIENIKLIKQNPDKKEIERLLALVEKLKSKNKKLKKKLKKKAIVLESEEYEDSTTEYEDSTTGYDSTTEYENSTTEYEDTTDESDESGDTESEQLLFDECVDLISTLDKNPKKIIEV